ncbi:PREDICTED: uncharacterized protein LOC101805920 [Ficedula albicollis]|uniref:uncharacterized protein LOC101805920 n=1 Tax=Ficedula albicollis TaxID=59894 RepID=UPI000359DAF1|nr:PREDICTED: uncharacterized protein LOC101805920 [Ficedula albicollis]
MIVRFCGDRGIKLGQERLNKCPFTSSCHFSNASLYCQTCRSAWGGTTKMEPGHLDGEVPPGWRVPRAIPRLSVPFCVFEGAPFSAGEVRERGRAARCRPRLRLAIVPPLPRRWEQLRRPWPRPRASCGPCLPTPGTAALPEPARRTQGRSPRAATRTARAGHAERLSPHGARGCPASGPLPRHGSVPLSLARCFSQIYGGRFAAGADLSSSVRGNECCCLNALPPQPLCFRFSKSSRVPRGRSPLLPGCET